MCLYFKVWFWQPSVIFGSVFYFKCKKLFWCYFPLETWQNNRPLWLRNFPTCKLIQNGRQTDRITRDTITSWCGPALFCRPFILAEISALKIAFLTFLLYLLRATAFIGQLGWEGTPTDYCQDPAVFNETAVPLLCVSYHTGIGCQHL